MDPFKEFVNVLGLSMDRTAGQAIDGVPAELGTITETGLKLDSMKHEMQDYLVADWLVTVHLPAFSLEGSVSGLFDGEGHSVTGEGKFSFKPTQIEEVRLNWSEGLLPGDRVLAIPVNSGNEAVVVCRIVGGGG